MPLRGGGVGPLMANAIKNFHFDYLNTSLMYDHDDGCSKMTPGCLLNAAWNFPVVFAPPVF